MNSTIGYVHVGTPLGTFDIARTQYVDAYGDTWKITPAVPGLSQLWRGVRPKDNILITSDEANNTAEGLIEKIDAFARFTRTNVAAIGSVLSITAAGAYVGYKTGGTLSGLLGALGAMGLAAGSGIAQWAGKQWSLLNNQATLLPSQSAATKGCGCSHQAPEVERASVGRSPYSLHHANASRFKAAAELALLEDHMINDPCPDCMNKHAMTASRLMAEAATLDGGETGDVVGAELIETIRQRLKPEADIPLANQSRDIRKKIQEKLKLSHVGHAHADH